jgi:uncharacterized protein (DUF779 family)
VGVGVDYNAGDGDALSGEMGDAPVYIVGQHGILVCE